MIHTTKIQIAKAHIMSLVFASLFFFSSAYSLQGQSKSDNLSLEKIAFLSYDFAKSEIDSCFFYARYLESQAIESQDEYWEEKAQYYLGVCYSVNGQGDESQEALEEFLNYAISINSIGDIAHTRYEMAQNIHNGGDLSIALQSLNQAIEGFQSIDDFKMEAKALVTKCVVLRRERKYDDAIIPAEEALGIYERIGDSTGIAEVYNALGLLKAYQGDMEGGIEYFKKQTEINEKINDLFGLGHSLGNTGFAYLQINDLENGEKYIKDALEIRRKIGMPYELGVSLVQLAEVYVLKKDYNSALKYSKDALIIGESNDNKLVKEMAYKQMSFIEEKVGRISQALAYYKKYENVKDSLLNDQISETAQKVEAAYQTAESEKKIQALEFEDQLSQSRISQQKWALGGTGVGLGILTILLYRLFDKNKEIKTQHGIISKAHKEKEVLLKEIHHRVKNNLQVISSLLGLQSLSISDQKTKDALHESRARVHSMSLIHQNLYQKDNLTGIRMETYVHKLCQDLINTYNTGESEIILEEDVQADLILDVESVVPIGLIINELVTNSLKYAFPNAEKCVISVELKELNDQLVLTVMDNGVGISEEALLASTDSFGLSLVRAFEEKLDAKVNIIGAPSMKVSLVINKYVKAY